MGPITPTGCSLLIPCYNAAHVLPRLWETVIAQTRQFDEIICYDDCSSDDTAKVVRKLGARLIVGGVNQGPAFARNALAQAAKGEWLHFHDADDLIDPSYLQRVLAAAIGADVVTCNADWVAEDDRALLVARRYNPEKLADDPISYLLRNPMSAMSALYHRDAFFSVGGFDEKLRCWEDGDLNIRLAAAGKRFKVVDQVLAVALRHSRGISSDPLLCARSRLTTLKSYVRDLPTDCYAAIAAEAQLTAENLLDLRAVEEAAEALSLCSSMGIPAPITRSSIVRAVAATCSPLAALRLQHFFRDRICACNCIKRLFYARSK